MTTDVRELERQAEARAHLLETSLTLVLVGPIGIGLVLLLLSGLSSDHRTRTTSGALTRRARGRCITQTRKPPR